jgi:hypothetical protein
MRSEPNLRIEDYRQGAPESEFYSPSGKNYGYFEIPTRAGTLRIVSSGSESWELSEGWEHVSVSLANRCPTWEEMSRVKELFWADDETVVQFHPAKRSHVNFHPFCLHLWKRRDRAYALPPEHLLGPKK